MYTVESDTLGQMICPFGDKNNYVHLALRDFLHVLCTEVVPYLECSLLEAPLFMCMCDIGG